MSEQQPESFEQFRRSFSYGTRTDLNFKFLAGLSDDQAADFFQELLWQLGNTIDDGNADRLVDVVNAAQRLSYNKDGRHAYEDGPFTRLEKPVAESRLALISSTGHFIDGDDPNPFGVEDMTQDEAIDRISEFVRATPSLSAIPFDSTQAELRARHGGYDVRSGLADRNANLPIDRLNELNAEGAIGSLIPSAYSFVGAAAQTPLIKKTGPQWADMLLEQGVEGAILVPV